LGDSLRRTYWLQAPGDETQIHDHLSGFDQAERLVDLLELVGRAGAIALFLGLFDIGVVDMVVAATPC
jgi:hypothetical protein